MPDDSVFNIADKASWPVAMKVSEVAQVLRITEPVVRMLIDERKLRAFEVSTGKTRPQLRVPRKELLAFIGDPDPILQE